MPERYRLMVLLAAWCGLRFGELAELRGLDIDTKRGVIKLRRAVVWVGGKPVVTTPKSAAGSRDVQSHPTYCPLCVSICCGTLRAVAGCCSLPPATRMRTCGMRRWGRCSTRRGRKPDALTCDFTICGIPVRLWPLRLVRRWLS